MQTIHIGVDTQNEIESVTTYDVESVIVLLQYLFPLYRVPLS